MAVFNRVIERIKPRGWHVVLHVDAPDIIPLSETIRKLPLPFVIDHMGRVPSAAGVDQPPLRALIELSKLENCWIKVCGSERISMPPYAAAVPIAHALVEATRPACCGAPISPHPNATHEADEADLVDLVPQFAKRCWRNSGCWWTIRRGSMVSIPKQENQSLEGGYTT